MTSRVPVDPPEYAGEATATEMHELLTRAAVIDRLERDLADAEELTLHLRRLRAIAHAERDGLIGALYARRGLSPNDEYQIAEDTGLISRVVRMVPDDPDVPVPLTGDAPSGG